MSRIDDCFADLRSRGETALVPFVTAGDPDLDTTEALVLAMAEAGGDVIELGIPFSDPIADGPTNQRSSQRALEGGSSLRKILALVRKLRTHTEVPIVLMGYANPVLTMGTQAFASAAAEVGVDGVIVVDLPLEEGAELYGACRQHAIDPVLLAAPTSPAERVSRLAAEARGFLYYVSLTGVTSARAELAEGLEDRVRAAKQAAGDLPICVGFGISTPEHAATVGAFADGVVVGSAIVNRIEAAATPEAAVDEVAAYIETMKAPLRKA